MNIKNIIFANYVIKIVWIAQNVGKIILFLPILENVLMNVSIILT